LVQSELYFFSDLCNINAWAWIFRVWLLWIFRVQSEISITYLAWESKYIDKCIYQHLLNFFSYLWYIYIYINDLIGWIGCMNIINLLILYFVFIDKKEYTLFFFIISYHLWRIYKVMNRVWCKSTKIHPSNYWFHYSIITSTSYKYFSGQL